MIEPLQQLITHIQAGEVLGYVLTYKTANKYLGIHLAGRYSDEPMRAVGVLNRATHRVNRMIDRAGPESPRGGDNVRFVRTPF